MFYGSEPIFNFKQFFYVRKDSTITFDGNFNKLKDYIIGTRIGFSYGGAFDTFIKNGTLNVSEVINSTQNTKKLVSGRIDLFIENPMNLISELNPQGELELMEDIKLLKPSISHQLSYITVSKKSKLGKKLVSEIDKYLREIKNDGTYQKILMKYFGKYELE